MRTGTHGPGPGGELQVGWQLDVGTQQCEQAQQEVHDLKGQEGDQVLLPVLEGRSILSGAPDMQHSAVPPLSPCLLFGPWLSLMLPDL